MAQSELEGLGREALSVMVHQLQAGLQAREKQLERQGEQLANMHEVQQQLQVCPDLLTMLPVHASSCSKGFLHDDLPSWTKRNPLIEISHLVAKL